MQYCHFFIVKSLHCFYVELVYIVSPGQQTVMFINTPRAYKRHNISLGLENHLRRQTSRTSIGTVHRDRICLAIRTENKAEVSICGVEMLYIYIYIYIYMFLLDHRTLLLNVNCDVKVTHHWTRRTCCLLRAVVSNGMLRPSAFLRSLHVAAFLWAWHICCIRKAN